MSSDGIVAVQVVDDTQVTGAPYEVRFRDTDAGTVWDLINLASGQTVLSDMQQHASSGCGDFQSDCRGVARAGDWSSSGHQRLGYSIGRAVDTPGQIPVPIWLVFLLKVLTVR